MYVHGEPLGGQHEDDWLSSPSFGVLIGLAMMLGGIAVTAWSYSQAAPGGMYVVASGAIIFGAWRLLRGLGSSYGLGVAASAKCVPHRKGNASGDYFQRHPQEKDPHQRNNENKRLVLNG